MEVISKGLRYKGKTVPKGKKIKNVSNGLAVRWIRMGFATAEDDYEKQVKPPAEKKNKEEFETSAKDYPVHAGGGWYKLSDGSSVQGKDEAIKAEKKLGD